MSQEKTANKKRFWALAAIAVLIGIIFVWESRAQKSNEGTVQGASVSSSVVANSEEPSDPPEPVAAINNGNPVQEEAVPDNINSATVENISKDAKTVQKSIPSPAKKSKTGSKKKSNEDKNADSQKDDHLSYRLLIATGNGKRIDCRGKVGKGSNVFDVLKDASGLCNFKIGYQDSSMGVFIESIGGVKNDFSKNMFWMFKVNGKMSDVGASGCKISNKDVIEWDYMDTTNLF